MPATLESLQIQFQTNAEAVAKAAADQVRRLGTELVSTEQTVTRSTQTFSRWEARLDGVSAASTRLAKIEASRAESIRQITRELERGLITEQRAQELLTRTIALHDQRAQAAVVAGQKLNDALAGQTTTTNTLTRATGSASMAVRQLGIQSIDVFQQLASGAPIMTTFIQQGGQITQVAAQGGVSFGQLARGVGSFVAQHAGIIAGAAAVAGLGAAIYSVVSRASEFEAQQRTLTVAIAGVGRSAELSSRQLQGYVAELKRQGVAAGDATAGVAALARNPALSGQTINRITALAPDAAAALGTGVPEMMTRLADAAKGTADAIEKLDDAFNLLSPSQAANVRIMAEHGDKAGALEVVFKALEDRVKGLNKEALSPTEQSFRDLGNAWDDFMNRIARSAPVLRLVDGLANALRNTNISDLTGKLAQLQGEASALQRDIAAGGNKQYLSNLQRNLDATNAQIGATQSQIDTMAGLKVAPGTSDSATGTLRITNGREAYGPDASGFYAAKETDRAAFSRVGGTTEGQVAKLTQEMKRYQDELARIGPRTEENAARFDLLKNAVAATGKAIAETTKKGEEHRDGLQKYGDTLAAQIKTQEQLAEAYRAGPEAVVRLTSAQKAQEKAISEGLVPGTKKYIEFVKEATEQNIRLSTATGNSGLAKQAAEVDRATESQLAIAAAYDGTQASITKATNEQRAYTDALKANLIPGTREFTDAVSSMAAAYQRSSDAAAGFEQAQRSVQAVMDSLSNVADRLGQGLVDAFVSGQGAAVNFGNIARAAAASLLSDFAKLAFLNPAKNALFGTNLGTLGGAFSAFGGGGGAGTSDSPSGSLNIINQGGNLLSGVGLLDTLGLTNIKGWIGSQLGLNGSGGLFSGIGSGINSILSTPLWSTGLGGVPLEGAYSAAQVAASGTTTTLGGLIGGVGAGFGLGSLAGGFLQNSLGKVGPAPQIGAGVGAMAGAAIGSIIPGVGTLIGGILGGLLGGGGGGLIGPKAPSAYSSTGISLSGGQLSLGGTVSQLVDTAQEVANATQQVQQLNALLAQNGIQLSSIGALSQIGQNTPGETPDPTKFADIASAFGQFRFTSEDTAKQLALADKSFASITELAQALQTVADKSAQVTDMLTNVIPALTKVADRRGSVAQQMDAIAAPYNQAFGQIQALMQAGQTPDVMNQLMAGAQSIIASLDTAYGQAWDSIRKQLDQSDQAMQVRIAQAQATASGDRGQIRDAALMAFDFQASQQRQAYSDQLIGLFGDAYAATADYARRLTAQDQATAAERLNVAKQYADEVVAVDQSAAQAAAAAREQATSTALNTVQSLSDYSRSLTYSDASPLSPMAQYDQAKREFQAVAGAARAGDFSSISKLSGYADTFLRTSRTVNGSGFAYATDYTAVQDTIRGVASQSVESIIASALQAQVTAAAAMTDLLTKMVERLDALLAETRQNALRPAA